jgi:hypothetical protein
MMDKYLLENNNSARSHNNSMLGSKPDKTSNSKKKKEVIKLDEIEEHTFYEGLYEQRKKSVSISPKKKVSKFDKDEIFYLQKLIALKAQFFKELKQAYSGNCLEKFNDLSYVLRSEAENKFIDSKRNQKILAGQLIRII